MGKSLTPVKLCLEFFRAQCWGHYCSLCTSMTLLRQPSVMTINTITLSADDMLLYRVINNAQDFEVVQQGINNINSQSSVRNFRPNFLHEHAECAKSRKLVPGIFLFQFCSLVMVVFVPPYVTMQKPYFWQ